MSDRSRLNMQFKIAVSDTNLTQFSLKKEDSDFSNNQLILNALIGTLVKFGLSGRLEPYLAESWFVSENKKRWIFQIRQGLYCEDGAAINAELIKINLIQNLKEYSHRGSVIMFDHLVGWQDFVKKDETFLTGLSVIDDNKLEFTFDENPGDLLELLRMPYFGLWRENLDGKIISSGAYKIKNFEKNNVTLELRPEWFTADTKSFTEVHISFSNFNAANEINDHPVIVKMPFFAKEESRDNGYWILSPPTRFEGFVLSPYKNSFFKNIENRKIFLNRVRNLYPTMVKSNYFYPSAKTTVSENTIGKYKTAPGQNNLTFALERATYTPQEIDTFKEIITIALDGSGISFELLSRTQNDKEWFKKTDSNTFFDARVSSVDIGAYPDYMALKMMFCSKLGVNFPDLDDEICRMVADGIKTGSSMGASTIEKFNQLLFDQAIVIPILHHSEKWFVSSTFDPKSLPSTTLYPQFELIRTQ